MRASAALDRLRPQHYFLTGYVGRGTDPDPMRPAGLGPLPGDQPHWGSLDLRPDPTRLDGYAILGTQERMRTGVYLGESLDGRSPRLQRLLGNRLALSLGSRVPTLRSHLLDLYVQHARRDGTRWMPVSRTSQGRYTLMLGPDVLFDVSELAGGISGKYEDFPRPGHPGSVLLYETFNTADSDTLGPVYTWTELQNDIDIVSNAAEGQSSGIRDTARCDTAMTNEHHRIKGAVSTFPSGMLTTKVSQPGVFARKDNSATLTYYLLTLVYGAGALNAVISKVIANTLTILFTGPGIIYGASGASPFGFYCDGSVLWAFVEDDNFESNLVFQCVCSDTAITGATFKYGGIRFFRTDTTVTKARIDEWHGDDWIGQQIVSGAWYPWNTRVSGGMRD